MALPFDTHFKGINNIENCGEYKNYKNSLTLTLNLSKIISLIKICSEKQNGGLVYKCFMIKEELKKINDDYVYFDHLSKINILFDELNKCSYFLTGDRSSPSSARRRGTDFTQMDASLWFTQAKCDLDSANNDMHPITGKPAYEWVCYKCYRVSFKKV